jgi:hypothetical protein
MNLDWPNLIAGGLLGLLLTPLPGIVIAAVKRMTRVNPTFSITGTWYSAEYDIKSSDPDQKNTLLKVELKRSLTGRITIRPSQVLQLANENRPTSWLVQGEMNGTVLVGSWVSTVPNSNRHGVVLLAFYDDGRGIGYCLGYADAPACGYWLLCRNEPEIRALSSEVMKKFKWNDLKKIVDTCDPRSNRRK